MGFIEGLNEAHMEADKVRQRKRLAAPHFANEEVPEDPKEITDFFKNFAKTSEADKIALMESLQERATIILIEHEARHLQEG